MSLKGLQERWGQIFIVDNPLPFIARNWSLPLFAPWRLCVKPDLLKPASRPLANPHSSRKESQGARTIPFWAIFHVSRTISLFVPNCLQHIVQTWPHCWEYRPDNLEPSAALSYRQNFFFDSPADSRFEGFLLHQVDRYAN